MKKYGKKLAASVLATCLSASLAVPVFAGSSTPPGVGTIQGTSTLEASLISVTVPSSLNFGIDPTQATGGPSQISKTSEYSITNGGDGLALFAVYVDVVTADGVELKSDGEMDDYASFNATNKALSFGAIVAESLDASNVATYNPENNTDSIVQSEDGSLEFGIVLAGKKYTSDGEPFAANNNTAGTSSKFSFYSRMNAYAEWKANDVKVTGRYLLMGVNPSSVDADSLVPSTTGLLALDVPKLAPLPTELTAGTKVAKTISLADGITSLQMKLGPTIPSSVTSVTRVDNGYAFASGTQYSYDAPSGVVTLKAIPSAVGTYEIAVLAASKTYTIALTITN